MILQLENISKSYGEYGTPAYHAVLDNISCGFYEGKKVAIVGPSGSGKTTLLNIIGTLDKPDTGKIIYKGKDLSKMSANDLAAFRNHEIGFVFQMHYLLPQCTLWENVMLPVLPFKKKVCDIDRAWAEHLLKKIGLWEFRHKKPAELSGGENQRTAVVRALINKPHLLLADEPTGALDETNAAILGDLLVTLSKDENVSLIVVTHSQELAARMDSVFYLRNGILN